LDKFQESFSVLSEEKKELKDEINYPKNQSEEYD
jgi:hypothetical protein